MVLLTLSLVFAGCSSKNTNKDDTDSTKDNNKVVSNESDEKVKITFWHNYGQIKKHHFSKTPLSPCLMKNTLTLKWKL